MIRTVFVLRIVNLVNFFLYSNQLKQTLLTTEIKPFLNNLFYVVFVFLRLIFFLGHLLDNLVFFSNRLDQAYNLEMRGKPNAFLEKYLRLNKIIHDTPVLSPWQINNLVKHYALFF